MTTPGAIISSCGTYRYTLCRSIPSLPQQAIKPCLFVMLNPSTADAEQDDPTIRRCLGFAKREGCTALIVVNLFALRATDPAKLLKALDPVGPENDQYLRTLIEAHSILGIVIAAWGTNPLAARSRDWVKALLIQLGALCLGTTKDGHPRHPLYVPKNQPLTKWVTP